MLILILGLVLFLGTHAFSMARAKRAEAIGQLGEKRFKLVYTLAVPRSASSSSPYGFHHYRAAGYIAVWDPPVWTRHLAVLLTCSPSSPWPRPTCRATSGRAPSTRCCSP